MAQQSPAAVEGRYQRDVEAELDQLTERVDQLDRRNIQLKNTIRALARESAHVSLGGVCPNCALSLTIVKEGRIYCPECGYQQSL